MFAISRVLSLSILLTYSLSYADQVRLSVDADGSPAFVPSPLGNASMAQTHAQAQSISKRVVVHTFIINLRKRRDRLQRVVRMLAEAVLPPLWELDLHRVDACTPADQEVRTAHVYEQWQLSEYDVAHLPPTPGSTINEFGGFWREPIRSGEVACFMSHMRVAKQVHELPPPRPPSPRFPGTAPPPAPLSLALVLEDDVDFDTHTFFARVAEVHEEVIAHDSDWHYISLGRAVLDDSSRALRHGPGHGYAVLPGYFYQTHAQLLSRAGAAKMLSRNVSRNVIAYDEWLTAAMRLHPRTELNALYYPRDAPLRVYASKDTKLVTQHKPADGDYVHDTNDDHEDLSQQGEDAVGAGAVEEYVSAIGTLLTHAGKDGAGAAAPADASALLCSRASPAAAAAAARAVVTLSAPDLCQSVFVVGAGSAEVNGRYVELPEPNGGAKQYALRDADPPARTMPDGMTREIFRVDESGGWWNMQTTRSPPLVARQRFDKPHYGAFAIGTSVPPTSGWASSIFNSAWSGRPPMPVVLHVASLFPDECSAESLAVANATAVRTPVLHAFTVSASARDAAVHVAAALRQGLQLQLQPGPWVNSVVGVFRHGLLRALVGTNPWDLVLYGSARDSAWLCDAAALEAVLRSSGRPILLSAGEHWHCQDCDPALRERYERIFAGGARSNRRYIDAGAWVGEAGALRLFAEALGRQGWATRNGGISDRAAWIEWATAPENQGQVAVDHAQALVSILRGGAGQVHGKDTCSVRSDPATGQMMNSCTNKVTCGVRVLSTTAEARMSAEVDHSAHAPQLTQEHEQLFRTHVQNIYQDIQI